MLIAGAISLFLYSLGGHITSRLFNRFDPSSRYSAESPGTWTDAGGTYRKLPPREIHQAYVFLGSVFWPASLACWLMFFLPYLIVLRIERHADRSDPPPPNTPYRGEVKK